MISESLMNKLAALKALASRGGTVAEGQAAAAMLQKLLSKHNLCVDDIEETKKNSEIIEQSGQYKTGAGKSAMRQLTAVLAHVNYCAAIYKQNSNAFSLVGTEASVTIVREMFDYLWTIINREANRRTREYFWSHSDKSSFMRGAVASIALNLLAIKEEAEREVENSTALICLKEGAIQEYLSGRNLVKARKVQRARSANAYYDGREFGNSVNLSKQIEN